MFCLAFRNFLGLYSPVSLDFSILQPVVESCISNIEKQIHSPGKYFTELNDLIATLDEAGHSISVQDNMKEEFDEHVRNHTFLNIKIKNKK